MNWTGIIESSSVETTASGVPSLLLLPSVHQFLYRLCESVLEITGRTANMMTALSVLDASIQSDFKTQITNPICTSCMDFNIGCSGSYPCSWHFAVMPLFSNWGSKGPFICYFSCPQMCLCKQFNQVVNDLNCCSSGKGREK